MRAFRLAFALSSIVFVSGAAQSFAQGSAVSTPPDPNDATVSLAIPDDFVAAGPLHRVLVRDDDPALALIANLGAIVSREDYGSFSLLVVDGPRVGDLEGLKFLDVDLADASTLINLNGYLLDGADAAFTAAQLATIPAVIRGSDDALALGAGVAAGAAALSSDTHALRIVQFAGPVKDEWLASLRQTGAHVITYVPNNAYVVRVDADADAAVASLAGKPWVLSISTYVPAFKLRPELRPPHIAGASLYPVMVQVIADEEGEAFAAALAQPASRVLAAPNAVLGYIDVGLLLDGVSVLRLANDSHVFAIEPKLVAQKFDERQGQIMAGNVIAAGTQPSGPGYLAWLATKGFPGADPFPFIVDVTDDGVDKGSTSDVNVEFKVDGLSGGASRYAYANNYSGDALADSQAGHGNINASIISGYNAGTGSAFEDTLLYNYGLGIAPWVKIGNSKVFSNAGAGVFNQPANVRLANAYNAGARISSNSWGYTSGITYNTDSQLHDQLVRDAVSGTAGNQELTIVYAAGNSGPAASTVHPPGTAKNVITVGAAENWRMTGSDGCAVANSGADSALDIINFSSRGPTSDSRKKPEICAPGTHIEGAASRATGYDGSGVCDKYFPVGQTLYAWSSGTSHSTPAISGACALLRQWFANNGQAAPSPALLKAWLTSSTTYMTGLYGNDTLWSNNQGFGLVNLGRAFDGVARVTVDESQVLGATGATYTTSGTIASSSQPFRVSLAWTDAPGPTTGNAFVNNLDLEVTVNGTLYRGNVFSGANSITGGTADTRNNLECVVLPAGTTGSFSVTVRATNIAGDGVPGNGDTTDQDFALVVYNGSAGAPAPDFTLSAAPPSSTVTAGSNASFTVSDAALNGFAGSISLSASPAISGVTYAFAPNPLAANGSSTLTCSTTAGASTGTQTITITGTSGALVHTTSVSLTINAAATPDFSLSATPPSASVTAGGNANFTVSNAAVNGFSGSVSLSASPAISGVSYSFAPNPEVANGSSTLTCATTAGATIGTQTITITGTSGALVHTASVQLTINSAGGGGTVKTYSAAPALPIPDNNVTGVTSTISVPASLGVSSVSVGVNVTHTYQGDLVITLIGPDGTAAILHNRTGAGTDNVVTTYSIATAAAQALSAFSGKNTAGNWSLKVQDLAAQDVGTLNSWTITFNGEQSLSPGVAIPDNNATGVTSTMTFAQTGTVAGIKVRVGITHTYQGDLQVSLIAPDGTSVLLHNQSGAGTDNINTEYPDLTAPAGALSAFTGKSIAGAWKLKVADLAAQDVGTLNSWTLSISAQ
jgi:subtilisin-like proprotein convertase family protein